MSWGRAELSLASWAQINSGGDDVDDGLKCVRGMCGATYICVQYCGSCDWLDGCCGQGEAETGRRRLERGL